MNEARTGGRVVEAPAYVPEGCGFDSKENGPPTLDERPAPKRSVASAILPTVTLCVCCVLAACFPFAVGAAKRGPPTPSRRLGRSDAGTRWDLVCAVGCRAAECLLMVQVDLLRTVQYEAKNRN